MMYELRVYHCLPGRLPALLRRFDQLTLKIWERHGIRQAGFFTDHIGTDCSNKLTYLLAWESLAERERLWSAFLADPDWLKGKADSEKDGPLVARIDNSILAPTAFSATK